MALVSLVSLLLTLNLVFVASSACPKFHEWPGTFKVNGDLVCAHIFEGRDVCSEESHIVALAQSQQFTAIANTIGENRRITFLIRPGCKVLSWTVSPRIRATEVFFEDQSVPVYSFGWNYTCECFMRDVKFLTCEPREDLHVVRECDFRNSSHVGICPFTLEEKPFRAYDLSPGMRPTLKQDIYREEETAVKTVLAPLVHARFDPPSGVPNVTANYIRYVPPKNKLVISQRVVICGSYVLPTSEIDLRHEAGVSMDAWIPFDSWNKSFYFSSKNASRPNASVYCQEHGGSLADLDHPKIEATVRDLARTYLLHTTPSTLIEPEDVKWWTAAEHHVMQLGGETVCFLKWPGNRIRERLSANTIIRGYCANDSCVRYESDYGNFIGAQCEIHRRFICEKDGLN